MQVISQVNRMIM